MSRGKTKTNYSTSTSLSKSRGNKRPNYIPTTKKKTPPKSLKQKLHDVYYGTINLDTTCKGRCECCKVAMPQMNFCEFSQLINEIWDTSDESQKIEMICLSIEYFFRNEFEKWGMDSLVKSCMLLSEEGKCAYYESRPLSCRLYGLWPEEDYNARVDKFEKAYEGLLKREELPLNKQCPYVKRVDESTPITKDIIDKLFVRLDVLDAMSGFSELRIRNKENYRTFHDWLLFKVFGEDWLIKLTTFMLAAKREVIEDQVKALKDAVRAKFAKDMPDIRGE